MAGRWQLLLAAALAAGCFPDLGGIAGGGGDGATSETGGPDGVAVDVAAGDSSPGDGNFDAPGSTLDGPACGAGLVCAPSPPSGWQFVVLGPSAEPSCPSGYSSPATVDEGVSAPPAACACACQMPSPPPPCSTNAGGIFSTNAACNGGLAEPLASSPSCTSQSFSLGGASYGILYGDPAPVPCGGSASVGTMPPVTFAATWLECAGPSSAPTSGCPQGTACVTQAPSPFVVCVASTGATSCPLAYPKVHTVGASVNDTRSCTGTCACRTKDTCTGTLDAYKANGCSGSPAFTLQADDACHALNTTSGMITSYTFSLTLATQACTVTSMNLSPTGSATLASPFTVCCP